MRCSPATYGPDEQGGDRAQAVIEDLEEHRWEVTLETIARGLGKLRRGEATPPDQTAAPRYEVAAAKKWLAAQCSR